jgi:hypothetical protein
MFSQNRHPLFRFVPVRRRPGFDYSSQRADRGNAHSIANPSFDCGAAGGRGSAVIDLPKVSDAALGAVSPTDFVSLPIASFVTVGGCQARRFPEASFPDCIGRILRSNTSTVVLWDRLQRGKTGAAVTMKRS